MGEPPDPREDFPPAGATGLPLFDDPADAVLEAIDPGIGMGPPVTQRALVEAP